jgi:hypothetical protein
MWDTVTFNPVIGTSIEKAAEAVVLYATFNKDKQFRVRMKFDDALLEVSDYNYKTKETTVKKSWEIIKQYTEWNHG